MEAVSAKQGKFLRSVDGARHGGVGVGAGELPGSRPEGMMGGRPADRSVSWLAACWVGDHLQD